MPILDKEKSRAYYNRYYADNPEYKARKVKQNYVSRIKRLYGLSLNEVETLRIEQDFKCAICKAENHLYVDHNHETGKVRGLLCNSCNLALGVFKDSEETLASAISYLKKQRGKEDEPREHTGR